ncbi:hypothetical protein SERLA73DRAFT_161914 [Serpula lacrymans var. lacrymans S7.3]|uniref:DUF6533 domain-containing protein n=1 Tax=Serpula lacrymans var. lacrymans (strain S7.3) TaxID=936435 RepID=F8Q4F0_SERL3|nr:hypothetical protein SERLA73DRAFT_161914 [Serpula lacrymans var. lacrymans S7.3]
MSVPLDLLEKTSISNPELLWITQCACVASLTLVLWEMLINLGDESSLIWPSHGSYLTIMVKWAYLFSRYFAIAVQIANINVIFTFARAAPVAADTCKSFYIYQGCSVEALLLAFDFALLARVHALYGQKKRYTIIGLAAILVELMTMFISGFSAIPNVPYNQDCLVMSTPTSVVYFVLGVGFSQCVILGMTYYKKIELERGSGGGRIPVLWIVVRDGALAFTVMASDGQSYLLTCRLILNMRLLPSSADETTDGQFTTNFPHLDRDPDSIRLDCVNYLFFGLGTSSGYKYAFSTYKFHHVLPTSYLLVLHLKHDSLYRSYSLSALNFHWYEAARATAGDDGVELPLDVDAAVSVVVLVEMEAVFVVEADPLFAIEEATASAFMDVEYEAEVVLEDVLVGAAIHSTSNDPVAAAVVEEIGADVVVLVPDVLVAASIVLGEGPAVETVVVVVT